MQDLPDRLGQPHCPGNTEAPRVTVAMGGGCPDKLYLSLKLGRAGWGTEMSQGGWTLVLPSRNTERVGDFGPLSCRLTFCCHPSLEALASRNSTLAHQEQCLTPGSTCLHL